MGKAVPKAIKMRAKKLLTLMPESFSKDFDKNKKAIDSLGADFSKTERNLVAGFITRKIGNAKAD